MNKEKPKNFGPPAEPYFHGEKAVWKKCGDNPTPPLGLRIDYGWYVKFNYFIQPSLYQTS